MRMSSAPGAKQVFRGPGLADVVAVRDEPAPEGATPLLESVLRDGRRTAPVTTLAQARERFEADLLALPPEAATLADPVPPAVRTSERLQELSRMTRERLLR